MYQKKYRHILFILLTIFLFCSGATRLCLAGSDDSGTEKKIELALPTEVLTSGNPFMIMMDSRGHQRVITYNQQPNKKLPEVHSDSFAADTLAVYAAESATELTVEANQATAALPSKRIIKAENTDYQQGIVGQQLDQALEITVLDENDQPVVDTQVVFQVAKGGGTFVGGATELTVTTGIDGKASVELILGTKTADNPIGWVEAGLNTQQVGLNVVECWPTAIPSYKTIFSVYGFPGDPAEIKFNQSDYAWPVLNNAGKVFFSILDQYQNPVSNVPVTVTAGTVTPLSGGCSYPNNDNRPAIIVPVEDISAQPPPFAYEQYTQYSGQPLVIMSDYISSIFTVYSGGTPNARYDVDITTADLHEQYFVTTITREGANLGNCEGDDAPESVVWFRAYGSGDHKPGDTIELSFWLYEMIEQDDVRASCGGCEDTVGKTAYFTGLNVSDIDFTVNGVSLPPTDTGYGYIYSGYLQAPSNTAYLPLDLAYNRNVKIREYQDEAGCYCTSTQTVAEKFLYYVPLTPLSVTMATSTSVLIDQTGRGQCDVVIPFEMDPSGYEPDMINLTVYEDEVPFLVLPIDPVTLAPPVIPRGTQFDPAKTYTASIRVNGYTEGRFDGTGSNEMTLNLSKENPVKYLYVENTKEKLPVMQEEKVVVKAKTSPEELANVLKWSLVARHPNDEKYKINAKIDSSTGVLTVFEDSGNGTVTVRASYSGCIYKDVEIPVGCQECSAGGSCSVEGSNSSTLSSVDFAISLGKTTDGNPAGSLLLRSETVSTQLYSPEALYFSSLVKDNEVRYDENDILRQILTAKTFVDITTETEYRYTVSLYRPDDIFGQADGLYTLNPAAVPFVVFQIENPDMLPTVSERLRITETRGSDSSVTEYFNDKTTGAWTLSEADGERITERSEQVVGDTIVRRETVKNGSGQISSVIERTYKEFPWGDELLNQADDPDGDNLVTSFTYYENSSDTGSYSKLKSVENPEGSWKYYEYDSEGRVSKQYSSWLDLDITEKASARVTTYSYDPTVLGGDADLDEDKSQPRVITETLGGIITSRKYAVYSVDGSGGKQKISETAINQNAGYGSIGNLRTITVFYPEDSSLSSGRLKSVLSPDGRLATYSYEQGSFDVDTQVFTPGAGTDERVTTVHGTESSPAGIALKTTKEESISNSLGNALFQRTLIYDGGSYQPVSWTAQEFDDFGRVIRRTSSDGTLVENDWSCCVKNFEIDAAGVRTDFTEYDGLHRLISKSREAEQGPIVTAYTLDASGRRLSETVSSGSLSLGSSSTYDLSGRILSRIDSRNLSTGYDYASGGRSTTETRPGGITEITETYSDGRTKSVTGTGVVPRFYSYGVNSDGSIWTQIHSGTASSPVWEKSTADLAGRTVKTEKPGYLGTEVSENFYNDKGQLIRTTAPGLADTLYEYDELGSRIRSGLDVDSSGFLEEASDDRINSNSTVFILNNGEWWQEQVQSIFAESGSAVETITGRSRTRLTGLGVAGLISETVSTDIHGNETVSSRYLDRALRKRTERTDDPDSDIDAVRESLYGLLKSSTDKSGVTTTYQYDALERRIGVTDSRTGQSNTHYNSLGQIEYTENAAEKRTEYSYDPITGRKSSVTDAKNRTIYYSYDDLGRATHIWGATSPVRYEYDEYGRMDAMHTWRSGEGWDSPTWPSGNSGLADITRWHYHEASGLLESKEDAQNKSTQYTYVEGGRLHTRTWARNGGSLFTTYSYDPSTGELTGIDYSDSTPDIGFAYYRTGQRSTVTDAVGSRGFTYNAALQPETESLIGLINRTFTRSYETAGVVGRNTGFSTDSNYAVSYGYGNTGRFNGVSWNVDSATDNVTYARLPNSHLLHTTTFASGALITNSYEPHRNLRTGVKNQFGATIISQYDYLYDNIGRRKTATMTGDVFENPALPPVPDDLLMIDTNTATAVDYSPNDLNQYIAVDTNDTVVNPAYDEDGGLTDDGTFTYTWNGENRLITVTPNSPAVGDNKLEFLYDYMGRRVRTITSAWDGAAWQSDETRFFVYDGWNMIEELDEAGVSTASYVHGLDLSQSLQGAGGIGGILARIDHGANKEHIYLYDANGNVGQLADSVDGSVVAAYEYAPFGGLVSAMGSYAEANPFRFSSKYSDDIAGLYYYGYRYYSPMPGRWLSRDPIGKKGGLNLYGFVENNPATKWDKIGLYSLGEAVGLEFQSMYPDSLEVGASRKEHVVDRLNLYANYLDILTKQQIFDIWYEWEKKRGKWWLHLPRCPKKLCKVREKPENPDKTKWKDPGTPSYAELALHPKTKWSMRSKGDNNKHANQCTYDEKCDLLLTPPSSGTVDWYQSGTMKHYSHDVEPIYLANQLDGGGDMSLMPWSPNILGTPGLNMKKYFEVRPLHAEQ